MATNDELLDALMRNCKKPEDLFGTNGLLMQLSRKTMERAIQTGMSEQPGCLLSPQDVVRKSA
ncbi:MAG: hypothetical protein HIU83_13975 [Proteobacteria bacterium]|nr:hypothetical protein [Pseudomonadota bacterium]